MSFILCDTFCNVIDSTFAADFGRSTKELYTVLGVLIFQQMKDLSDEETVYQLAFSEQWHSAFDITSESDDAAYMSSKTLWSMRKIVTDNGLDQILFHQITDVLARVFKVDTSRQRIDSVHIRSNMQCLGRIRIFAETIHKFLINLRRRNKKLYETVAQDLKDRYVSKTTLSCFSMVKPSDSGKTLKEVSSDLFDLLRSFSKDPDVTAMHGYKLMSRILQEQCVVTGASDDTTAEVSLKPPKEIPSDSLQNPSASDATYDGHKGQGYQVQVMETYSDEGDREAKSRTLNLIPHVEVQTACESDAGALIPAIESAKERNLAPKELLADSLYGSDDNCKESAVMLSDFTFSDRGKVIACPQGHAPVKTKHKKTRHTAAFTIDHCANCSLLNECPVKAGKKYYYLRYEDKAQRIAGRRALEQTDEFKDRYRRRAGSEATISEFDRRTDVKRLCVRGFNAVRFCAALKATGINIFRATAVRMAIPLSNGVPKAARFEFYYAYRILKEFFYVNLCSIKHLLVQYLHGSMLKLKSAT